MHTKWAHKCNDISKDIVKYRLVKNCYELISELFNWKKNTDFNRFVSPFICRGMRNVNYDILSSLQRCFSKENLMNGKKENVLLRNFGKYAVEIKTARYDTEIEWMILGRHHKLPTRIVDWSGSPLVALYNATNHIFDTYKENSEHNSTLGNAVVWCLNIDLLHKIALPDDVKMSMEDMNSRGFTPQGLADIGITTLAQYDKKARKSRIELNELPICMVLDPPMIDQRIVNQHACFTLLSRDKYGYYPVLSNVLFDYAKLLQERQSVLKDEYPLFKIIEIDSSIIQQVADYLEQSNICHRVLYPGLEGVAKTLENRYLVPPDDRASGNK